MKKSLVLTVLLAVLSSAFAQTVPGIFLQEGGWLWTQKDDGVMAAKVKLSEGTELDVYPESKDSAYEGGKSALNFVKVKYESKDYWAISNRLITGKKLAVLTDDVAVYNTPHPADVRNTHLDKGSLVAIGKKQISPVLHSLSFVEVTYYSTAIYGIRTVYMKDAGYSDLSDDIMAFRILSRANELTVVDQKKTILQSALKLNVTPEVRELIQEEIDDLDIEFDLREGGIEGFAGDGTCIVKTQDGSKINLRDFPGLGGNVIGQLEDGTMVIAYQVTSRKQRIDGIREYWYELYDKNTSDYLGWAFGGYLSFEYEDFPE